MIGDPLNDPLDDVLQAPLVPGPRRPVSVLEAGKLAKRSSYRHKLALAEANLDRWLSKLLRASNQVDAARKQVRRYRKIIQEERT